MSCLDTIKIVRITIALTVFPAFSNAAKFYRTDVQNEALHNNGEFTFPLSLHTQCLKQLTGV